MPEATAQGQETASGVDQDPTQQPAGTQVERSFETGSDEFWKFMSELNAGNFKEAYDLWTAVQTDGARNAQQLYQRAAQAGLDYDQSVRSSAALALSNAVDTANLVNKQAVAHRDIAINNEWDQQAVVEAIVAQVLAKMAQTQQPTG